MVYMLDKKIKKNLALPKWVVDIMDKEADLAQGLNVAVGAAMLHFSTLSTEAKAESLKQYRCREIDTSFGIPTGKPRDVEAIMADFDREKEKDKKKRKASK